MSAKLLILRHDTLTEHHSKKHDEISVCCDPYLKQFPDLQKADFEACFTSWCEENIERKRIFLHIWWKVWTVFETPLGLVGFGSGGTGRSSAIWAKILALARPIWKYIVMYPFSPLQANLKIPRKTLALFAAKKKPFPMQIQKLSYLHLGLNLISGPQNTKSERHSNDVDFFWKPLIKIRFFDRLWPLALWGCLVQDELFPNLPRRMLNFMKMPRAWRGFSKLALARA